MSDINKSTEQALRESLKNKKFLINLNDDGIDEVLSQPEVLAFRTTILKLAENGIHLKIFYKEITN